MVTSLRALALGWFVLSLGVTSSATAAPAQQNKMKAFNEQTNTKEFGEGKMRNGRGL